MQLAALSAVTAFGATVLALGTLAWAAVAHRRDLLRAPRGELASLGCAVLGALAIRLLVPAYERTYTDEAYYTWAASEMLGHGGFMPDIGYGKSHGWPALLAVAFAVAGRTTDTAVSTSLVLGLATPVLLYAAGAAWAGRNGRRAALAAGVLFTAAPVHALWSRAAESNVAGAFTMALVLLGAALVRRAPSLRHGLLFAAATAVACATRPEALVLAVVLAGAHLGRDRRVAALAFSGILVAAPDLWLYATSHVTENVERIEAFGIDAARVHVWNAMATAPLQPILLALAIVGFAVGIRSARGPTLALAAWLVLTLALLSVAGTGALAMPERFLIAPDLPAALLGGVAVHRGLEALGARSRWLALGAAPLAACALAWLAVREIEPERRPNVVYALQHRLPALIEGAAPRGRTLVANRPEMYRGTTDFDVIASADVLDGTADVPSGAIYVWDMTCFEWHFPPFAEQCAALSARADPTPRATFPLPREARSGDEDRRAMLLDLGSNDP